MLSAEAIAEAMPASLSFNDCNIDIHSYFLKRIKTAKTTINVQKIKSVPGTKSSIINPSNSTKGESLCFRLNDFIMQILFLHVQQLDAGHEAFCVHDRFQKPAR